jgi:hypothetical protein
MESYEKILIALIAASLIVSIINLYIELERYKKENLDIGKMPIYYLMPYDPARYGESITRNV